MDQNQDTSSSDSDEDSDSSSNDGMPPLQELSSSEGEDEEEGEQDQGDLEALFDEADRQGVDMRLGLDQPDQHASEDFFDLDGLPADPDQ